ncbi:MAG: addiction module antidote protein, HigA family [Gemmatimonadetes bacterium]|nr:addiction module antidote protein, HigA family [Gemmatimonadota bacterium]
MSDNARHPGTILKDQFLDPLGITPYRLAKSIGVHVSRVAEVIKGRRGISADTAVRLGLFFEVPPRWWLDMQAEYDIANCMRTTTIHDAVAPYEGINQVLVTPTGARRLSQSDTSLLKPDLVSIDAAQLDQLKRQAELSGRHSKRVATEVTYASGAVALVGTPL